MNDKTKKVKEKTVKLFLNRIFVFGLLIIAQCSWLVVALLHLYQNYFVFDLIMLLVSYGLVLYIINKQDNPAYKLIWIILLLIIPIVGAALYLMFGNKKPS